MSNEVVRRHVFFTGRVQGVFFRANTRRKAQESGISGWVRNLSDGRVEAVFEGPEERVREIIEWCSNSIPHARVDKVEVREERPKVLEGLKRPEGLDGSHELKGLNGSKESKEFRILR